jgi:hypothetical protein
MCGSRVVEDLRLMVARVSILRDDDAHIARVGDVEGAAVVVVDSIAGGGGTSGAEREVVEAGAE